MKYHHSRMNYSHFFHSQTHLYKHSLSSIVIPHSGSIHFADLLHHLSPEHQACWRAQIHIHPMARSYCKSYINTLRTDHWYSFHSNNPSFSGIIVAGLTILVLGAISYLPLRWALKKWREKDGAELRSLHGCSVASPSSTLPVQGSYPALLPLSLSASSEAPMPSWLSQTSQQSQQPEMVFRIDARSSGSTVVFNFTLQR